MSLKESGILLFCLFVRFRGGERIFFSRLYVCSATVRRRWVVSLWIVSCEVGIRVSVGFCYVIGQELVCHCAI